MKYADIKKCQERWKHAFSDSNERGRECIAFAEQGKQWEDDVIENRRSDNKETLVFNLCWKHLRKTQAKGKDVDVTLELSAVSDASQQNVEESQVMQLVVNNAMLNTQHRQTFKGSLAKVYQFGYSVMVSSYKMESRKKLNRVPYVYFLDDPSQAFFDLGSVHPNKIDGNYCGIYRSLKKEDVLSRYPSLNNSTYVKDSDNIVIDCWYRKWKKANYKLLVTGEYKREDLITPDDELQTQAGLEDLIKDGGEEKKLEVKENISDIYFVRYLNDKKIVTDELWPTEDLPMVYEPGSSIWTPDGQQSYPFVYHMMGAQILHNFAGSQAATLLKQATSDKWLAKPGHVQSPRAKRSAREINKKGGTFVFDEIASGEHPQRQMPAEVPMSLANFFSVFKQEIDEIAGAFVGDNDDTIKQISGVALDKLYDNIDILQNNVIDAHIQAIDIVGQLIRQMIPKLYTENRTLILRQSDGSSKAVEINKLLSTGDIANNVRDINDNYFYELKAGPSTALQKKQEQQLLESIYSFLPDAIARTADIFIRNSDVENSDVIARRLIGMCPPIIVQYSKGEVSEDEVFAWLQQQQQQQAQSQQNTPQLQLMNKKIQNEKESVQTKQYEAETKRSEAVSNAQIEMAKLQAELQKAQMQADSDSKDRSIELIKESIARENAIIDSSRRGY